MRARYVIGVEGSIDVLDRGLAYGDGVFETMALRAGRVLRLALHLDRLQLGCNRLAIPCPDRTELSAEIAAAARDIESGVLKLMLTRGPGERGYTPPAIPTPTVVLLAQALDAPPISEISLASLQCRLGENVNLAGIKHLNRLEQILGRLELGRTGADEGLMLSTSGAVIGGTSRNLFAVFEGGIKTPDVSRAGIAGVMRRVVLEACADIGIPASEAMLTPDDLSRADELFMTNALVGIQSVAQLDGRALDARATAQRLRRWLDQSADSAESGV